MFVSYFALLLVGITWTTTDGVLEFTQEPGAKLYFQEGSNAVLTWDYKVDNKTAELDVILWRVFNKSESKLVTLILENKNGVFQYSNKALSAYGKDRLKKEGNATLVLMGLTFEDSTDYRCILRGKNGIDTESIVKLIVTGRASATLAVIPVKEPGGSATLTCNATAVPGQNFTWMRKGQNIVSDSKYEITPDTGSSRLTIKNISISDHGYYVCDATVNVNQPSSARGFLGVQSLKEDTELCPKGDQYAAMNKTTTICCPVRGFPPPEVTWKLPDGTKLTTGNTMLPITPEKADFGNYTCSAVNVGTVNGPFVISLKQERRRTFLAEIVDKSGVTELKPGDKFSWSLVTGALNYRVVSYIVKIHDNEAYLNKCSSLVGGYQKTSLEIPYNTLQFKNPNKNPKSVDVIIEVLAIDGNNEVIGKGKEGGFPKKIKNAAATLEVSFISVIMLFIMVIIFH